MEWMGLTGKLQNKVKTSEQADQEYMVLERKETMAKWTLNKTLEVENGGKKKMRTRGNQGQ